jgi:glycosyltransferase involved in cell wall biosynthesis
MANSYKSQKVTRPTSSPLTETLKPVRVVIVAPSLDILGGQAVQAARLLERLRQEPGVEVDFLPVNPRLPGVLRKLQAIKYVRTAVTSIAYLASLFNRLRKYDVVHIFSASYLSFLLAPTPAILVARLYGKAILLNYHSGEAEDHLQRWRRSAIPTLRLADELIVPSPYLVRIFAKFGIQAKPIYNLIETDRFRFRERLPLRPVFLSNRNFEKHYGVDCVLRAFAVIQDRIPQAQLIIAGDGPERASLEPLARDLKLQNTEFVGRVGHEKVVELYDAADIFLNGSLIDNQPLSLLEAFACGLPVVTTDAGGIPDMVAAERTGLLVPMGAHEELAAGAFRLLDDSKFAQALIQQAREECRKYRWEALRDEWLDLYYDLGAGSGARQIGSGHGRVPATTAPAAGREDANQPHAKLEENQRTAI